METSDYFERILFHDRSPEADGYYESSAGLIFEERCLGASVEVRIQSCSQLPEVETNANEGHIPKHQAGNKEIVCDTIEPDTMPATGSDRHPGQSAAVYDGCHSFVRNQTKCPGEAAKNTMTENYDTCSVSSWTSSTALSPAIDEYRKLAEPPVYPGPFELAVVQLPPCDIERFVSQTKNSFRIFYLRQRHSHGRLQVTKETFERLLGSCHVFPRFTEYVTGLCAKMVDAEVGPPPLKFRPLRSAHDDMYRGFGTQRSSLLQIIYSYRLECCYILRFVELTQRERGRKPWSLRQFAVYHRYKSAQNSPCSTWILAGMPQCTKGLVEGYTRNVRDLTEANPFELHMIFLDKCIANWRPYLAHLTQLVHEQVPL